MRNTVIRGSMWEVSVIYSFVESCKLRGGYCLVPHCAIHVCVFAISDSITQPETKHPVSYL
jgi:hypothetical protein